MNQVCGSKNFVVGDSNVVTDSSNGIYSSTKSTICSAKGSAILGGMKNSIYSDNSVIVGGSDNLIGLGSQNSVIDGSDSIEVGAPGISVFGGEDDLVCSNPVSTSANQTLIKKKILAKYQPQVVVKPAKKFKKKFL